MIALLHIQLGSISEIAYDNPLAGLVKTIKEESVLADVDNHSEKMVIAHAIELIKSADKVVLLFTIKSQQPLGGLQRILSILPGQERASLRIILSDHHPLLEKLCQRLDGGILSVIPDHSEAQRQILEFIKRELNM